MAGSGELTVNVDRSRGPRRGILSPAELGGANQAQVLQELWNAGPLSRADLARRTGSSRGTVGAIVQSLMGEGLLEERPSESVGQVGKPARPVWFRAGAGATVSCVLDATGIETALVDAGGSVHHYRLSKLPAKRTTTTLMRALQRHLSAALPIEGEEVLGFGLALPAVCSEDGIVLRSTEFPELQGVPLAERLADGLAAQVYVDNTCRTEALGEKWFGAARGVDCFVSVRVSSGVSAATVVGGRVVRGAHGASGELGHVALGDPARRCLCGLKGCWQTIANRRWLRERAAQLGIERPDSLTLAELTRRRAPSEPSVAALLSEYMENIAVGVAAMAQIIDPQIIVLHGDIAACDEETIGLLRARTHERVIPDLTDLPEIEVSPLDNRAALLGSAGLVLSETYQVQPWSTSPSRA